jgi:hypothetical protein
MSILHSRQVALDEVDGKKISTVWLGINYNFNGDKPKILETMVFEKESHSDIYCVRYSTWEEAEKGHAKAIEWVKAGCVEE